MYMPFFVVLFYHHGKMDTDSGTDYKCQNLPFLVPYHLWVFLQSMSNGKGDITVVLGHVLTDDHM